MPVAMRGGEVWMLLGRERYYDSWSGFGGTRESGETPIETAAREFMEESMAIIMSHDEIEQILQHNLDGRLLLRYQVGNYIEHVVQIEYDSKIPSLFSRVERQFSECAKLIHRSCQSGQCSIIGPDIGKVCSPNFEKDRVEWFSLKEVMGFISQAESSDVRICERFAQALMAAEHLFGDL